MEAVLERNLGFMGYPNYSVDTNGNVFARGIKMKQFNDGRGYLQLQLNRKTYHTHRLVAMAFIPNIENKPCIDHINCDRTDNRVCNLRWCSYSENMYNPLTVNKLRKTHHICNVLQYTKDGVLINEFKSTKDAEKATNISRAHIGRVCRGIRKTAGGYIWRYKKEDD